MRARSLSRKSRPRWRRPRPSIPRFRRRRLPAPVRGLVTVSAVGGLAAVRRGLALLGRGAFLADGPLHVRGRGGRVVQQHRGVVVAGADAAGGRAAVVYGPGARGPPALLGVPDLAVLLRRRRLLLLRGPAATARGPFPVISGRASLVVGGGLASSSGVSPPSSGASLSAAPSEGSPAVPTSPATAPRRPRRRRASPLLPRLRRFRPTALPRRRARRPRRRRGSSLLGLIRPSAGGPPVQSFWAAGIVAACENDGPFTTYFVHPTTGGTQFLNGEPSCACCTASKATSPGPENAQGSL